MGIRKGFMHCPDCGHRIALRQGENKVYCPICSKEVQDLYCRECGHLLEYKYRIRLSGHEPGFIHRVYSCKFCGNAWIASANEETGEGFFDRYFSG